jgi:integrase
VAAWNRWVTAQTQPAGERPGMAAETVNHYLRALRGFFRWLVRCRRLGADPLGAANLLNPNADRRVKRRVLTPQEFHTFIDTTRSSAKCWSFLDGPARAALYLAAARTGLRAGTLAKLRPEDLRLDDDLPHIPTEAHQQKNRRAHKAPITADLLAELRTWLMCRRPGELLWPGKWHTQNRAASIVRRDLAAAGLPVRTADGVYDFHALRGQCGTDLARAGVPLTVTQQYLGHSTPALTAKYYVHLGLSDLAGAAEQLGRRLGHNRRPRRLRLVAGARWCRRWPAGWPGPVALDVADPQEVDSADGERWQLAGPDPLLHLVFAAAELQRGLLDRAEPKAGQGERTHRLTPVSLYYTLQGIILDFRGFPGTNRPVERIYI